MKNKSLITAFSLSKESENTLKRLQNKSGKSRSEIVRNLLNSTTKKPKIFGSGRGVVQQFSQITPDDSNRILKYYYQLITESQSKPTIVIGIAIISSKNKVLIGLRKATDVHVKNLSWTFPSGKFHSLNFIEELSRTVFIEVGLKTKDYRLIHARLIPDSPQKKVRIVALYYQVKIVSGKPKAGGDFKQLKWIPATDVTKFFTTSVSDEIMNFLGTL